MCKNLLLQEPCLIMLCFIHTRVHVLSAEPASACSSFAMKNKGVHQKEEGVIQVSPSLQRACTAGGTNIWTGTQENSPETEPPKEKRAKIEGGDAEPEEGEIIDSSDDEKEGGDEGNTEENASCDKSPANDMEVIKDEPADS